jgi:hypothetical protein
MMESTLPEGLKVWYEYGETQFAPSGRRLPIVQVRGLDDYRKLAFRRYTRAHVVEAESRREVATGIAVCNPRDNFCKATGRAKSLGRALSTLA